MRALRTVNRNTNKSISNLIFRPHIVRLKDIASQNNLYFPLASAQPQIISGTLARLRDARGCLSADNPCRTLCISISPYTLIRRLIASNIILSRRLEIANLTLSSMLLYPVSLSLLLRDFGLPRCPFANSGARR
jgi:hypothetical protein